MFLFGRQVYVGWSLEAFWAACDALAEAGIRYRYRAKVSSSSVAGGGRFPVSTAGGAFDTTYTIRVSSKDYEQAKYVVDRALYDRR